MRKGTKTKIKLKKKFLLKVTFNLWGSKSLNYQLKILKQKYNFFYFITENCRGAQNFCFTNLDSESN